MTGHIFIYGEIGANVTAKSVQEQIDPKAEDYEIHISSVGGDVYEGYAIYGILSNLTKPKTIVIEGLCASIATLIAQAGDKVVMTEPAEFMIHNPNVSLSGESDDLIEAAGQLNRIKKTIISVYQKRTGLSEDELSQMMDVETWMSAQEAKQRGFVDEVHDKLKAVAYIDTNKFNMSKEKTLVSILNDGLAEIKNLLIGKEESVKNMATVTLEDGRVVMVGTESENPTPEEMVGASIVLEDGTPLEDGVFVVATGAQITVAGGVITEAVEIEAEPSESDQLKAKIAELEAALQAKDAAVAESENKIEAQNKTIKTFKASVEKLEAKINEFSNITVGDPNGPKDAPNKQIDEPKGYDPMASWFDAYKTSRR